MMDSLRIAVILPCHNEEAAVAETVAGFRALVDGEYDDIPEGDFYMKGSIEQVLEAAKGRGEDEDEGAGKEAAEQAEAEEKEEAGAAA